MCCTGSPTKFTSGFPGLDQYLTQNMKKPANQYPGPVSSQINPLMTGGANIMSNYAGQGNYTPPAYNTYASMMGQGQPPATQPGGGGSGGNQQVMQMIQQLMASRMGGGKGGR